jgi:hypothetical protein
MISNLWYDKVDVMSVCEIIQDLRLKDTSSTNTSNDIRVNKVLGNW